MKKNVYKTFGNLNQVLRTVRKTKVPLLITTITVIIGFLMVACDGSSPGTTPLSAPANLSIDVTASDLSLKWTSVANAASYSVQIGSNTPTSVSTTSYSLKSLALVELKPYIFKVKAVASSSSDYTDSVYAELNADLVPYVFEFEDANGAAQNIAARATSPSGVKITGLTSFGKTLETVNIPETINGASVTVIGEGAFNGSAAVTVNIPATVTSIEANAFQGCTALETVIFNGDTPPTIHEDAFSGATSLKEIVVPEGSADDYESALPDSVSEIISEDESTDPGTGPGDGEFSVSFDVTDAAAEATLTSGNGESIDNLTISLGETVTFTVANEDNQYSNIEWFVNGTTITETGASFELDSSELSAAGTYAITIKVEYNGMPYSRTIAVTVEE